MTWLYHGASFGMTGYLARRSCNIFFGEKMKIEVEISEDEIRNAVELKIRSAVSDQSNHWSVDDYIKTQVKAQWQTTVESMILDMLNNSQLLREKIATELERKLRAQLAAAIKAVTGTRFTQ